MTLQSLCRLGRFTAFIPIGFIAVEARPATIDSVRYLPFEEGRLESNEVENTSPALGAIHIHKDVAVFFRNILQRWLSEYDVANADGYTIDATIEYVNFDWRGLGGRPVSCAVTFEFRQEGELLATIPFKHKAATRLSFPPAPANAVAKIFKYPCRSIASELSKGTLLETWSAEKHRRQTAR